MDDFSAQIVVKEGVDDDILLQLQVPIMFRRTAALMNLPYFNKLLAKEGTNRFSLDSVASQYRILFFLTQLPLPFNNRQIHNRIAFHLIVAVEARPRFFQVSDETETQV
ncbi:MAG: hypothetical protein JST59_00970 [Actinobacteria bacterium]|nr:hypothetical protein [Actinomycetota bacterium]